MTFTPSPSPRLRVLVTHLGFSMLLVAGLAFWVLTRWYPGGLLGIQGGVPVMLWVIAITVIIGPLLTLILFRPEKKGRRELLFDLTLIVAIQLGAFGYGAWVLSVQRPVYLTFLYDRFFLITPQDVLGAVPAEVQAIPPWSNGPRPVFVKLSLGAQLEAATTVYGLDEAPPMALLPGAYAPLSEGRPRFQQLLESSETKSAAGNNLLHVPVVGRAGKAQAVIDASSGELLRIE